MKKYSELTHEQQVNAIAKSLKTLIEDIASGIVYFNFKNKDNNKLMEVIQVNALTSKNSKQYVINAILDCEPLLIELGETAEGAAEIAYYPENGEYVLYDVA